jgi:hypothetical protein
MNSILILFGFVVVLNAQELRVSKGHSSVKELNCSFCHGCMQPSKEDPCLKLNPQLLMGEGKRLSPSELPPDMLLLDELEDKYEPVKFSHRQHAHMAEKSSYCVDCHHFLPPGMAKQPCKECHAADMNAPGHDLSAVSLNAAYHRTCLSCHVEWSKVTNCDVCHAAKDPRLATQADRKPVFRDAKQPEKTIYLTRYFSGPFVNFSHTDHTKRKNVVCRDCHNASPCIACHYQDERPEAITAEIKEGVHGPCSLCHQTIGAIGGRNTCIECHKTIEQQKKLTMRK